MKRPELNLCSRCGRCLAVCPTYVVTRREAFSPRGRIFLFESGLREHPALETCLACGNCEATCPNRVALPELVFLKKLEKPSFNKGPLPKGPLPARLPRKGSWLEVLIPRGIPKRSSRTFSQIRKLDQEGDITLFLSCGAEYLYPEATHKLILFLRSLGYSPRVIGPLCCGLPAASLGLKERFLEEARKTLETLLEVEGPILTLCASCLWVIKKIYPLVFPDLEEGNLQRLQSIEETLTHLRPRVSALPLEVEDVVWHIPCHLKAFNTRIRLPGPRINLCCGSATPQKLLWENRLPKPFLEKLNEFAPPLLVTACTGCYLKLRKLLKPPPEVKHWAELLSV